MSVIPPTLPHLACPCRWGRLPLEPSQQLVEAEVREPMSGGAVPEVLKIRYLRCLGWFARPASLGGETMERVESTMVCEACGATVEADRFCTNCGTPLTRAAPAPAAASSPAAPDGEPQSAGRTVLGAFLYVLLGVGVILVGIAAWKFYIDGFYPDELVPFAIVGAVGIAICWIAAKLLFRDSHVD